MACRVNSSALKGPAVQEIVVPFAYHAVYEHQLSGHPAYGSDHFFDHDAIVIEQGEMRRERMASSCSKRCSQAVLTLSQSRIAATIIQQDTRAVVRSIDEAAGTVKPH